MANPLQRFWELLRRLVRFYAENRFYRNYFSSTPIVTYIGSAHSRNLGDVLLYKATQRLFTDVSLVPFVPRSTLKNRVLLFLLDRIGPLLFQGLRRPSALMLGGGTLMNCGFFFDLLDRYRGSDLPFLIFGSGMQDVDFYGDQLESEIEAYRSAVFVGVRDPYAAQVLGQRGVPAQVLGDPVLALCRPRPARAMGRRIGINVGCDRTKTHADQADVNRVVSALSQRLIQQGWQVEFFAMHDHDVEDIRQIQASWSGGKNVPSWLRFADWQAFLDKILDYDLVIGQRLHSVITATGSGIPAISLSYRPKCLHFMESVGMESFCLRTDQLSVEEILEKVTAIEQDYDKLQSELLAVTGRYRRLQSEEAKRIQRALRDGSLAN